MASRGFFDSNKSAILIIGLVVFISGITIAFAVHSRNQTHIEAAVSGTSPKVADESETVPVSKPESVISGETNSTQENGSTSANSESTPGNNDTTASGDESGQADESTTAERETDSDGFTAVNKIMKVAGNLNVRAYWSADSEKLGMILGDETVKVTGESENGWSRVEYDGKVGYVATEYLVE